MPLVLEIDTNTNQQAKIQDKIPMIPFYPLGNNVDKLIEVKKINSILSIS